MPHRSASIALLLAALGAPAFARGAAIHLTPTGTDDTAQLQAALDSCSGAQPRCRIVLAEGVFYTDVLLVRDFRGRIVGQGAGKTIVRPVPDRPLRSTDIPLLEDPTLEEPYPILMHFADGGDVHLADFTLDFPEDMEAEPYTLLGLPVVNALFAAVMVDGTEEANLTVARLEINATERPPETSMFGSALLNAVRLEGRTRLADPSGSELITTPLERGTFVVHDVSVRRAAFGLHLRDAFDVHARIVDNDLDGARFVGIFLVDLDDSRVRIARNRVTSEFLGAWIVRGARLPVDPNTIDIERNEIRINEPGAASLFGFGDGVALDDFTGAGIDDVTVRHNDFVLGVPSFEAVFVSGDRGGVLVARNKISGVADAGITIFSSQGTRTRHNDFANLEAALADVWLDSETSECRVIEPGATVLDEGTDNEVETGP